MSEEFIIAGWLDYGVNRDAVLAAFTACAEASRLEDGCLDYVVTADPSEPGRVVVFERWDDEQHLAAHFRTPHIAVFRDAIAPYPRVARDLHRYFVARSEQFSSSSVPAPA
jgi:quinol monooxygenase YgiN